MEDNVPNPGSKAAQEAGCICPVIDNEYGEGMYIDDDGQPVFVINMGCPIHNKNAAD